MHVHPHLGLLISVCAFWAPCSSSIYVCRQNPPPSSPHPTGEVLDRHFYSSGYVAGLARFFFGQPAFLSLSHVRPLFKREFILFAYLHDLDGRRVFSFPRTAACSLVALRFEDSYIYGQFFPTTATTAMSYLSEPTHCMSYSLAAAPPSPNGNIPIKLPREMANYAHRMDYSIAAPPPTDNIPKILPRPVGDDADDVSRPLLAIYAPELVALSGRALRSQLFASSQKLMTGLNAVQLPHTIPQNALPLCFTVPVQLYPSAREAPAAIYPTHILAVSASSSVQPPIDAPVALTAVHGAIIAANCTRVALRAAAAPPADARFVRLATHRLSVASLPAFVLLRGYMYARRIDTFMAGMMPFPPAFLDELKPENHLPGADRLNIVAAWHSPAQTRLLAGHLAFCTPGGPCAMWERMRLLEGVWKVMCELGMYEQLLWRALDLAWHVARYAVRVVSELHEKVSVKGKERERRAA
ncbi:hypothetical protein B0H12DRAFT_1117366 [Mycena haematopus]|nr:hypothetical protein B0H12DRAFT_1117366 [Mycena haematopus]